MSACDTLCPSKMYILLIVFHQSVQEEWIAGQALRAVLSVSHVTMEGKPARHVGDWGVGEVGGDVLCDIGLGILRQSYNIKSHLLIILRKICF